MISALYVLGFTFFCEILILIQRPISALPVNTDVPRLCRKILVVNGDDVIFDGSLKTFTNAPVNLVVKAMFGIINVS
jgi:hypothetical protein